MNHRVSRRRLLSGAGAAGVVCAIADEAAIAPIATSIATCRLICVACLLKQTRTAPGCCAARAVYELLHFAGSPVQTSSSRRGKF